MNRITASIASLLVTVLVAGTGVLATTTAAQAAAPSRNMTAKLSQPGGAGRPIYLQGTVQNYPRGKVLIQHRSCNKPRCKWVQFKTVRTNANKFYKTRVSAPKRGKWFWRAAVKPAGAYGFSSAIARGYTFQQ